MEAFTWDQRFETGIDSVDKQHQHLVDLVNLAGDILLEGKSSETELQKLFGQLADYAVYHFNEEENLMAKAGVDQRHVTAHKTQHSEFLKQVTAMWNNRDVSENPASMLHGFLSSWLTVHILGQDQEMARILQRMQDGMGADGAYDAEHGTEDRRISPLLDALHRLYILLSLQNRALAEANSNLEEKVRQRTQALEEASEQVLQSEKMASLGRMVAGFAHEINTPVGIALSAVSLSEETIRQLRGMLDQEEVSEEEFTAHLETLKQADRLAFANLNRAAELVRSFKRTSIDQSTDHARLYDVAEVFSDVVATLHNQFKNTRIEIKLDCPEAIQVYGAPGHLEQLLTNLLLNSLKHGFADGRLAGEITISASQQTKDQLEIVYRDNGQGMREEVLQHAFEPFFTTSRGDGGTGLGLYICYNIVKNQLRGDILLDSRPSEGCRFSISIPCHHAPDKVETA